jgi:hypothetical protein
MDGKTIGDSEMFKRVKPTKIESVFTTMQFPHCDQRILHAPGECEFCDCHPDWQELRQFWGIAYTGYEPEEKELPCPAEYARGEAVNYWPGNRPHLEEIS